MKKGAPPSIPGLVFVQPLGSGGYADVYLYEQQSPRMPVAVKVLKSEGLTDALRAQFVEEADTMAALGDHPYIVQVFRSGTSDDGRPYLVMKYYPPPNLAMRARAERFSVEEVLRTGIQLASAVETAHRAAITHRDIKPANVLISAYGAPGLTDFGIAGRGGLVDGVEPDPNDDVGVSVPWAAPEVLYGQSNGDESSDVYSLAATLWQLLVGRSPFEVPGGDNSAYALMPRIRSTPPPATGRPDVPVGLERLLGQAMAKDPAHRLGSALELARALQTIEAGQRLARTPIVVLDEQGHTTLVSQTQGSPSGAATDDDRTRIKAPQTVLAQPMSPVTTVDDDTRRRVEQAPTRYSPAAMGSSRVASPAAPTYRVAAASAASGSPSATVAPVRPAARTEPTTSATARLGGPSLDGDTVERPSRASTAPGGPSTGTGPGARGARLPGPLSSPAAAWSLVVGVVVLAALVVFLILRPTSDPTPTPAPTPTIVLPSDTDAGPGGVMTSPTITADSAIGSITFRWSYPDPRASDTFRLYLGPTASDAAKSAPLSVKERQRTVKLPPGGKRCALVLVNREGIESPLSDAICETAR